MSGINFRGTDSSKAKLSQARAWLSARVIRGLVIASTDENCRPLGRRPTYHRRVPSCLGRRLTRRSISPGRIHGILKGDTVFKPVQVFLKHCRDRSIRRRCGRVGGNKQAGMPPQPALLWEWFFLKDIQDSCSESAVIKCIHHLVGHYCITPARVDQDCPRSQTGQQVTVDDASSCWCAGQYADQKIEIPGKVQPVHVGEAASKSGLWAAV